MGLDALWLRVLGVLIATLQLDAVNGALIMFAFGLGTLPALLIAAFGAERLKSFSSRPMARTLQDPSYS